MPTLKEADNDANIEFYPDTNIPVKGKNKLFIQKLFFFNDRSEPYYHILGVGILGLIFSSLGFLVIFKVLEFLGLDLYLSVWSLLIIVPVIAIIILLSLYFFNSTSPIKKLPPYISIPAIIIIISQAHFLYKPLVESHYYKIALKNQNFNVSCEVLDEYITQSDSEDTQLQYQYTININNETQNKFENINAEVQLSRGTSKIDVGDIGVFEVSTDFPDKDIYPITNLPPGYLSKSGVLSIKKSDINSALSDLKKLYGSGKEKVNNTIYPVIHVKADDDIEKDIPCESKIDWFNRLRDFDSQLKDR